MILDAQKPIPPGNIAIRPEDLDDLRWSGLFQNENFVEVEIGCGKAGFLLRRAQAHPETNFLGIEWANEFFRYAVDRMERWKIPNVRLVRTDASQFVRLQCPRGSLSALHIYHPDPWPKKRHHRRRLFQQPFVAAAAVCLKPGGRLAIQTDHAEYFEIINALVNAEPLLEETEFCDPAFGVQDERIATNFETKYLKEGRTIHRIALRRKV